MTTGPDGIALIESFEGCKLESYQDGNGIWTIGYGHTGGVGPGQSETQEQAEADLRADLATAENAVTTLVEVALTQHQFDALVCFTYNVGAGHLKSSTLLRLLNQGEYEQASQEFAKWNIIAGKPSLGLTRRRAAETALFEKPAV